MYSQNKYKTFEEKSHHQNLFIAKIAVFISVISVLIGNIFPLFGKQDVDYLHEISQQLDRIESQLNVNTSEQEILHQLEDISNTLVTIESHTLSVSDEISSQLKELYKILGVSSSETEPSE